MLNASGELDIPFVFEGEGSAFCVPPPPRTAYRAMGFGVGSPILVSVLRSV